MSYPQHILPNSGFDEESGSINPAFLQMKDLDPFDENDNGNDNGNARTGSNLFVHQQDAVKQEGYYSIGTDASEPGTSYENQQYNSGATGHGHVDDARFASLSHPQVSYPTPDAFQSADDSLRSTAFDASAWQDTPENSTLNPPLASGYPDLRTFGSYHSMPDGQPAQFGEDSHRLSHRSQSSTVPMQAPPVQTSRPAHHHRPSSLSLDPSSAQYPSGRLSISGQGSNPLQNSTAPIEWPGQLDPDFQGHRRHSSNHSNISSALSSPFVDARSQLDSFSQGASPLLVPAPEDQIVNGIDFGDVSLMEPGSRHSSIWNEATDYPDPYQQPLLTSLLSDPYGVPQLQTHLSADYEERSRSRQRSLTTQLPIPEIQVDLATNTGQPNPSEADNNARGLSPRSVQDRGRIRSRSDPYLGLAAAANVGRSSSTSPAHPRLHPRSPSHGRSVSPQDHIRGLISPSPITRKRAVSASSLPVTSETARTQILGLATGESGMGRRAQKHPAKYKCKECGSAFTRMYNLHSHMRTHTNERPFVCSVCNKAFARQHDRRRHEQLHSGTRKFMCEVTLHSGQKVGCKRKFARADALGRHFKSEAGKKCIQPLLDEDRHERMLMLAEQHKDFSHEQLAGMVPEPTFGQDGIPDLFRMRMPALSPIPSPRSGQPSPYESQDEDGMDEDFKQDIQEQQFDYLSSLDPTADQGQWTAADWQGGQSLDYQVQPLNNGSFNIGSSFNIPRHPQPQEQYAQQLDIVSPADLGGGDFVAGGQGMTASDSLAFGSIPNALDMDGLPMSTQPDHMSGLPAQSRTRW